jgi:hypothetical protein
MGVGVLVKGRKVKTAWEMITLVTTRASMFIHRMRGSECPGLTSAEDGQGFRSEQRRL